MADLLTEAEIFKKIAWTGFWGERHAHKFTPSFGRVRPGHSHKTVSRMPACGNGKLMRTCSQAVIAGKRNVNHGGISDEKEHTADGACRVRTGHRATGAGRPCGRYKERHHVQGQDVQRLNEERRYVEGQHVQRRHEEVNGRKRPGSRIRGPGFGVYSPRD